MGQALTHGIYLPDEGERNCYSGLAGNWQLLDGAVGTIAEHTTQIAGKAPAVHTHTKSDVTDLLNSNFIPSANNSYDLGSSSYQWNNVYSKGYYYNGTAWGLDKENTWSQNQIIASGTSDKCYYVKDTVYELGQTYSNGEHLGGLTIHDKNGSTVGLIDIVDRSYGNMEMRIRIQQKYDPNSNNRSTSGNILFNELIVGITPNKQNYIKFDADLWGSNHNLGTSTAKWKTLNGINPGALSLPDLSDPNPIDSGAWVTNIPTNNAYTPSEDGWLNVVTSHAASANFSVYIKSGNFYASAYLAAGDIDDNTIKSGLFVPVLAGQTYYIVFKGNLALTVNATFYPAKGNV